MPSARNIALPIAAALGTVVASAKWDIGARIHQLHIDLEHLAKAQYG
ncbi:MAG TPA: hypothetical protein VGJ20_30605 [Xanthobacteraceae bacterium]